MRTLLIAALLAGVATPALAARPDNEDRSERHHERSEKAETRDTAPRQERSVERAQQRSGESRGLSAGPESRANASEHVRTIDAGHARAVEQMRTIDAGSARGVEQVRHRGAGDSVREWRGHDQAVQAPATSSQHNFEPREVRAPRERFDVVSEQPSGDTVSNWRSHERRRDGESGSSIEEHVRTPPAGRSGGDLVQSRHPEPRVFERTERRISRRPVFGTEPPPPRTATAIAAKPARHWRTDWRHDHRYDWRNYRHHHRSHFHLGFYYDPFGWDYMQYGIGWRLWPSYYRSSFWLNDPWQYRLPPAYGPYRWIRYYNDALLVNIYTGEVVDVEYNFFW